MPWFEFIFGSGATSGKFEDDAADAGALGVQLEASRAAGERLLTSVTIQEDAPPAKRVPIKDKDGNDTTAFKLEAQPAPPPEVEITGSWDSTDVKHIVPYDEALEIELEGDDEPEEAPIKMAPRGTKK